MFALNKNRQGNDTLSSARMSCLRAPRSWKPHIEEGSPVQEGSRGNSWSQLPGNPTPSLTNTGKQVPPGRTVCLFTRLSYLPAWQPAFVPCFQKDKVPRGATLNGTGVTIAGHVSAGGKEGEFRLLRTCAAHFQRSGPPL